MMFGALGLVIVAIHSVRRAGAIPFGASDVFKLVDPATYRSLSWADLPAPA